MRCMNAKFSVSAAAQTYSEEHIKDLLCLKEFSPPFDLSSGNYRSDYIPQRFFSSRTNSNLAGLSMFWNYMKVVRRDRALALQGEYSDYLWGRSGLELSRLFETYGADFEIQGLEHLQAWLQPPTNSENGTNSQKSPVVFAVNHMSTLETQTICGYITPYMPTTFVVKSSLTKGYFAPLICSRPYIALERKNPLTDLEVVLQEGSAILQGNSHSESCGPESKKKPRSIIIFPQGTREVNQFSRSRFNSIAVKLAAKAGVAVVPVALSTNFWSRSPHKAIQYIPILKPEQKVHFAFGSPLQIVGRGKQTQTQILDFISDSMRQWDIPVHP